MISICVDCNYDNSFIQTLREQVSKEVSKKVNRYVAMRSHDLAANLDTMSLFKLVKYNEILEQVLYCNSCYAAYSPEDIVSIVKNTINGK